MNETNWRRILDGASAQVLAMLADRIDTYGGTPLEWTRIGHADFTRATARKLLRLDLIETRVVLGSYGGYQARATMTGCMVATLLESS